MKCETSEGAQRELFNGGEAAMYSNDQQVSVNLTSVFFFLFLRQSIWSDVFLTHIFLFLSSANATASLKLFARQWRGRNAGWNHVRSVSKSFRRWENYFKQSYSTTLQQRRWYIHLRFFLESNWFGHYFLLIYFYDKTFSGLPGLAQSEMRGGPEKPVWAGGFLTLWKWKQKTKHKN